MTPRRISLLRAIRRGFGAVAFAALLSAFPACSSLNSSHHNMMTQAKVLVVTPTVAFGSVPQGVTSPTMTATLMSTGTASLTFTSNPTVTGANASDFAITAFTCSTATPVAVGQSCTVTLTFKPKTTAAETASLNFADNASPATQTVMLTGTGTAAMAVVTLVPAATLAFGPVPVGTTSTAMTVTLTNTGSAILTFTANPSITGTNAADFAIVAPTTCSTAATVAVGTSCTVNVTFKPSTSGAESAFLNFADNAANSPQTLSLTGGVSAPVSNAVPLTVDPGPAGNALNILYASVTICVSGTATCQTIDHVQVDTGSSGLRLLASQVTIPVPQAKDSGGNPLANCVAFADGSFAWGPMATADIKMAGEVASSQAIQLINSPGFVTVPTACSNGSVMQITNQATLGANGLLGVGVFRQDCGAPCAGPVASAPPVYFSCPLNTCSVTSLPLLSQLQNPVWMFPQDNNGVLITLPSVPVTGSATITGCATPPVQPCGSMIFGIGTQPNNALGSAKVFTTDAAGDYTAIFNAQSFPASFVDSGSNGFFFLDTATTSLPACTTLMGFYCPAATANFTVTTTGANGTSASVMFSITNAETLHNANPSFAAFSNIGGPFSGAFDFGSPFFYGRPVFTGIEGQSSGAFVGPFFAY